MNNGSGHGDFHELAALRAVGLLSENDAAGEVAGAELLQAYEEIAGLIGLSATPLTPRPELRERLLSGLSSPTEKTQVWREWRTTPPAPIHVVAAGQGDWEPIDIEGIRVKRLYSDPAKDTVALLIQMDPGTAYPSHRHAGPEHCYVISGDLNVGGVHLNTGDYQVATTESVHTVTRTTNGCTILIISSLKDELLA